MNSFIIGEGYQTKKYIFGMDIGGTTIKLGLFRLEGELLEKWEIPTRTVEGGTYVLPDAVKSIKEAAKRYGISESQVEGIGIGGGMSRAENVLLDSIRRS